MEMAFGNFFSALLQFVFAAFVIERALSLFFETQWFINSKRLGQNAWSRVTIALLVGVMYTWASGFDVTVIMFNRESGTMVAEAFLVFFHGAALAGGSKASLKLMRDVLKIKSYYQMQRESSSTTTARPNPQMVHNRLHQSKNAVLQNPPALHDALSDMGNFAKNSGLNRLL